MLTVVLEVLPAEERLPLGGLLSFSYINPIVWVLSEHLK